MAHIDPRNLKPDKNGKPRKSYLVRWIDAAGKERAKSFPRLKGNGGANSFKTEIESALMRGTYVDPRAGDITLKAYAETWRAERLNHRPKTAYRVEHQLKGYVYPYIGDLRLGAARRPDLQKWVSELVRTQDLAPSSVLLVVSMVKTVFARAVADELIARNPCAELVLPEVIKTEVVIPTDEQLTEILAALRSPWYRRLVTVAAGTGLRSGEIRGLTEGRVDWLRRTVKVDRQLVGTKDRQPVFGPPKTNAGHRTIPVAQCVVDVMAEQIADRGTGPGGLIFTNRVCEPITGSAFNQALVRALDPLGWPEGTGCHLFRHYYASLLIHKGLSVKVVQKRLGHATAAETLDTYGHLWPDSDEDSRTAVAETLGPIISGGTESPSGVRESVKNTSRKRRRLAQNVRQADPDKQLVSGETR